MKKLLFIFIFILTISAQGYTVYSFSDITPPTIHSVSVLEKVVQAGDKITIEVNATDDISGISSIIVSFKAPSSNQMITNNLLDETIKGNTYLLQSDSINKYAEVGIWSLDYILISDIAGNTKIYSVDSGELSPVQFELTNTTQDKLPPVVHSVEVIEKIAGPGNKLTIKVDASDDISGISSIMTYFKAPTSNQSISNNFFDFTVQDNIYTFTTDPLNRYIELGIWELDYVMISDYAGNTKIYSVDFGELDNVQFEVSNAAPKELQWTSMENIQLNKTWEIELSSKIDLNTLNHDNIFILKSPTEKVPVKLSMLSETKILVSPLESYLPKHDYQLNIKGLKSSIGTPLNANIKLDFITIY